MKLKMAILAASIMTTSVAFAQVDQEAFNALVGNQGETGSADVKDDSVTVEDIDIPNVFKDIDSQQVRIKELEKMITIATLEKQYAELTGQAPDGSSASFGNEQSDSEGEAAGLRKEIMQLRKQVSFIRNRMENDSDNPAQENTEAHIFREADSWKVKGISIYGDDRAAVVTTVMGEHFVVHPGEKVGDAQIISITPDAVKAKEAGKVVEIPLASSGYSNSGERLRGGENIMGNSFPEETAGRSIDAGNQYPAGKDSTSW